MLKQVLPNAMAPLALLMLLVLIPGHVRADEVTPPGGASINGIYELKEVTAAGVYSAGEEADAQAFVGFFLTVHGDHVVLPTSELCHVTGRVRRTLKNDRDSFGTAGGSWSEVGLQKTSAMGYDVTEISLDCDGPFQQLVVQPQSDTYLLSYWSVFFVLGRE